MGADLLMAVLTLENDGRDPDFGAAHEELKRITLRRIKDSNISLEDAYPDCPLSEAKMRFEAGDIEGAEVEVDDGGIFSCDKIIRYLDTLEEAYAGGARDSMFITIGHLRVFITGGMSWGDSPSDTFEAISSLQQIPEIWNKLGFDNDNINYKEILEKVVSTPSTVPILTGIDPTLDKMLESRLK